MILAQIKKKVDDRIANRDLLQNQLTKIKKDRKIKKMILIRKETALELIKDTAQKTQSKLEKHLSEMVTTGLNTVFEDPYGFRVIFDTSRNMECHLYFEKHGHLIDPLRYSGLGAADVAAFCLRCAAWSMDKKYRNTLILDEPFKHLKGREENIRAIQLMNTLAKELKLQIICVNDERAPREDIIANSDRTFVATQNKKGHSRIKKIFKEKR